MAIHKNRTKKNHRSKKINRTNKRKQKMKGCNKNSRKKYLGGGCSACSLSNFDFMKGGEGPMSASSIPTSAMPNTGAANTNSTFFMNPQNQRGGSALVGSNWKGGDPASWPGVNGQGNNIPLNDYKNDISRGMIASGANPPFSGGKRRKGKGKNKSKKQRGGALDNLIGQDLLNLGRQFQSGLGNAYNGISGYQAAVSPMPWKQMPNLPNLQTIQSAYNY